MGTRDDGIPKSFVQLLLRLRPAMKQEPVEDCQALAYLAWVSPTNSRKHSLLENHMHITYQELAHRFGRDKFNTINGRVNLFDVTTNWWHSQSISKGYKLKADVELAVSKYVANWRRRIRSKSKLLLSLDGKQLISMPQAIASKDTDGITAKAWERAAVKNRVPIRLPLLVIYSKQLERMLDDPQFDLFIVGERADYDYKLNILGRIMGMARQNRAGDWFVIQRYIESKSGRLYGKNINLQTVPKSIKQAALNGMWEYDFSNCHYSILHQLAARHGLACDAIAHYCKNKTNKEEVRGRIMADAHLTADQAKTCLIALIYGARFSVREEDAIPKALDSKEKAAKLYQHPLFMALKSDVTAARGRIIGQWPRSRKALRNDYGKWISERASQPQILAHLLQGIEAKMLETARRLYDKEILLLQHDGFASSVKIDMRKLGQAIKEATGFEIGIEEERIHIEADFGLGIA